MAEGEEEKKETEKVEHAETSISQKDYEALKVRCEKAEKERDEANNMVRSLSVKNDDEDECEFDKVFGGDK